MVSYNRVILYFDGASRSNPRGPAGCGWVLYEMDSHGAASSCIVKGREYLGHYISNNQAEYQGLLKGLEYIYNENVQCNAVHISGDSQIVIHQMKGLYQVRSSNIRPYYDEVKEMIRKLDCKTHRFLHVPWWKNDVADSLADQAISEWVGVRKTWPCVYRSTFPLSCVSLGWELDWCSSDTTMKHQAMTSLRIHGGNRWSNSFKESRTECNAYRGLIVTNVTW